MEITEVASGVHNVSANRVNWQIVEDGSNVTLIDAGWPKDYGLVVEALSTLGRTPADLSAILITHGHVDHIGCAQEMLERHQIRSHIHEVEAPLARGEIEEAMQTSWAILRLWKPDVLRFSLMSIRRGALSARPITEVATFDGDQPLSLPGGPVPLHTPGHTRGSCSYHFPDRGVLVTGDALVSMQVWTEQVEARVMPAEFNANHPQAIESLSRLEDLPADVIVTGHGPPYRGSPKQAVMEARETESVSR